MAQHSHSPTSAQWCFFVGFQRDADSACVWKYGLLLCASDQGTGLIQASCNFPFFPSKNRPRFVVLAKYHSFEVYKIENHLINHLH
jgi:hypothetical protein